MESGGVVDAGVVDTCVAVAALVQVDFGKRRARAFWVHPGAPIAPNPPVAAVDATVGLLLDAHSFKEVLLVASFTRVWMTLRTFLEPARVQ